MNKYINRCFLKKMARPVVAMAGIIVLMFSATASAAPFSMTFDGIPRVTAAPYSEDGMIASTNNPASNSFFNFLEDIGPDVLGSNLGESIFIEESDGSAFDLFSVDLGSGFLDPLDFVITADLFLGGTVISTVTGVTGFVNFAPTNFRNITRVTFASTDPFIALDNIIGDTVPSAVPIPAAAWLFGSALLGLGVVKRKRA